MSLTAFAYISERCRLVDENESQRLNSDGRRPGGEVIIQVYRHGVVSVPEAIGSNAVFVTVKRWDRPVRLICQIHNGVWDVRFLNVWSEMLPDDTFPTLNAREELVDENQPQGPLRQYADMASAVARALEIFTLWDAQERLGANVPAAGGA